MLILERQAAKFANFNPKPELHGQDPQPAGDIAVEFNMDANVVLPMLDPQLRGFLFHKNGAVQHDLADETAHAPDLRFPAMPGPFEWAMALEAATLTLHVGDLADHDIVLPASLKKPLTLTPMQGGTVVVRLQARCHPDADQAGKLYMLMGRNLDVSFDPGAEVTDED
jgi:hypothetical protein